jgi:predicted AlkP superfamily pyrophosphatase or phosphodiesterase
MSLTRRSFLAALLVGALTACREAAPPPPPRQSDRPIVILISIDGFRWDYLDRFAPPVLSKLAAEGVRAEGLIPQFPSKTFPNHYTIVTGLTLAHHGIISNNIRDANIPGEFSLSNRQVQMDPRWWGGEPIWNTVEKQGLKAAAMFWPGSEAVIGGRQASYWTPYDDDMPHAERIRRVLEWLRMPQGKQPSFLTLYFSDVDNAGHRRGPDSQEVHDAVTRVDASLGLLVDGVKAAGLADRVNYVIVSDHGMAALSTERTIVLDDYVDLSAVDVVDWSPVLGLAPKDGDVERVYAALKDKHPALAVYRRHEIPAEWGLADHPRVPPIFGVAKEGWNISSKRDTLRWVADKLRAPGGAHGYDNTAKSMQGLFVASGPGIKSGVRVKPFSNLHLYEFMCAILGVQPAKNDGDPAVTRDILR